MPETEHPSPRLLAGRAALKLLASWIWEYPMKKGSSSPIQMKISVFVSSFPPEIEMLISFRVPPAFSGKPNRTIFCVL